MSKTVAARKTKTSKSDTRAEAVHVQPVQPAWVIDMHRHFGVHGYYRPSDLNRVLGSPAGHTGGSALPDFSVNGKK